MPGTVEVTRNTAEDKMTKISILLKLTFWWGTQSINKLDKIDSMLNIRYGRGGKNEAVKENMNCGMWGGKDGNFHKVAKKASYIIR